MKHQRTFVISLVVLLSVVVFTACVQVSAEEPNGIAVQQSKAAPIPKVETEVLSGSEFFATNPELMVAGRHSIVVDDEGLTGSSLYAANPELMAAGRYTAPANKNEETSGSEFFAANPELMTAGRYLSEDKATESEFFAANPELMTAQRYTATNTEK
jgi:hypothetical protein